MPDILELIKSEVSRQVDLWGEQNHPDGTGLPGDSDRAERFKTLMKVLASSGQLTWRDILYEEVLEVFDATDAQDLRIELIQVAAVAVSWVKAIDRISNNGNDKKDS